MKYKILIVDDTPANIEVLREILKVDYSLSIAINGDTAIKISHKIKPDLILLDVMMPGMNGYEVCEILKKNSDTKNIPIIFVTALTSDNDEKIGFNLGAVDYITKPISPATVKVRVKNHLAFAHQQKELDLQVIAKTNELNKNKMNTIACLVRAASFRDDETGHHIRRVREVSALLAEKYGINSKEVELLKLAAPMHDLGKIGVEDAILNKPGKLNEEELMKMRLHPEIGANILGNNVDDELLTLASIISMQHHERWDGTGYPNNIKGDNINVFARIVSIADVFDALISDRPYKKAWTFEQAYNHILKRSNDHFDPALVKIFTSLSAELKVIYSNQ